MSDRASHRVTIVTVSYNSLAVLPRMLGSLPEGTPAVVVDNASADLPALRALVQPHAAQLIENAENIGFGPACNRGAETATTEFVLFLNPDAALAPGALEALVDAADRHPEAIAMNPRIENEDGSPAFKRRSVLLPRSRWMKREMPGSECEVSVLSGAALMVRRTDFEAVGGFDPAIFLYHEDDDLSLRLAARGKLMIIPAAVVRHAGGHSTVRSAEVAALKAWHMGRSRVYAMRKHGRPFAASLAIGRALVQMLSPLTVLSARKRAKHVAFLRGTLQGARNARTGAPE